MFCFASGAPLSWTRSSFNGTQCTVRSEQRIRYNRSMRWRAKAADEGVPQELESVWDGVDSGAELREKLKNVSDARKEQAEMTARRIEEMNAQLNEIMRKINADIGAHSEHKNTPDEPSTQATAAAAVKKTERQQQQRQQPQSSNSSFDESSTGEPYMDPSTFGLDSTAGWQVLASSDILPDNEDNVQFRIECDMNGCSMIQVNADAPPGPGVRQKFIHSGTGFRVGYDPEAPKSFCAMVGNEQWLLALSRNEVRHFKRLMLSLQKKMEKIESGEEDPPVKKPEVRRSGDGMFNERVGRTGSDCSVELESRLLWVQAFGQPKLGQYGIRAIFMEGRQSEGSWASDVVPNMLAAVAKLAIDG